MRRFNKQLIAVAAACGSLAAIGVSWAQTQEPADNPPAVINSGKDAQILYFKDQGSSPETNPSAHLSLVKDEPTAKPVAAAEPAPAPAPVAEATPAPAPEAAPAPAPEAAPAPAPEAAPAASDDMSSHTDAAAPEMPAPKADRN